MRLQSDCDETREYCREVVQAEDENGVADWRRRLF
jgi:hypothetical protein